MSYYTDLNFNMKKHPFTGDVLLKNDVESVKQALLNLLMTRQTEKPFEPNFGCNVRSLLFENFSPFLAISMQKLIQNQVEHYEPRCQLEDVIVEQVDDNNELRIELWFYVKGIPKIQSLNLTFERIR